LTALVAGSFTRILADLAALNRIRREGRADMYLVRCDPRPLEPLAELAAQYRNTSLEHEEVGRVCGVPITVAMLKIVYELYFRMPLAAWPNLGSAVLTDHFDNDWLPGELAPGMREQ
jgi:hypothetical protein